MNKNIAHNVDVMRRVNVDSDHRMVRGKIKMNKVGETEKMKPKGAKVNIEALKQKDTEFRLKLQNRFENLQIEEVEEMALNFANTIKECALEIAGRDERRKEEKLKQRQKNC